MAESPGCLGLSMVLRFHSGSQSANPNWGELRCPLGSGADRGCVCIQQKAQLVNRGGTLAQICKPGRRWAAVRAKSSSAGSPGGEGTVQTGEQSPAVFLCRALWISKPSCGKGFTSVDVRGGWQEGKALGLSEVFGWSRTCLRQ